MLNDDFRLYSGMGDSEMMNTPKQRKGIVMAANCRVERSAGRLRAIVRNTDGAAAGARL